MINRYAKGANFERKVVKRLLQLKSCRVAFRSAGSHSPIDVVAVFPEHTALIQCKTGGKISNSDVLKLLAIQDGVETFAVYLAYLDKGTIKFIPIEQYRSHC